jgi:hypothetical protein
VIKTIDGRVFRYTITKARGGWLYKVSSPHFGTEGWVRGYKRDATAAVNRAMTVLAAKEASR